MDFLYYIFVLLNEALRSFCNCVLIYGVDVSVSLLWIAICLATFNFFFSNFNMTTPLSDFVIKALKKGKYLNQGALGGPFHRVWKMKQIENLGRLLVEVEDNNGDTSFDPSAAKRRYKRYLLERIVGLPLNWDENAALCHPNPLKARQARRAFVGRNNWSRFKELPPNHRKAFFKLAAKL